ncbi:MAG: ABC transporter ATP-binding protein [Gemmatimonadales bacterium]|nr:ABC transporter ATP-binding protein [Gemmatimonadales bacterium]MBP7621946.1 ABC transporter ATP-binding protein [Gemmatimonadales bacterium]MBP9898809.1 ABC transporter ATP-binding protein [Gemmatimonadales bacterium]
MSTLLDATDLVRYFIGGDGSRVEVLSGASLTMAPGECVAITGASGTGKSTLLHLLGALDRPDRGTVRLEGVSFADLGADALADVRNRRIGFVFQFHHLLRDFTATENVMMPLLIAGVAPADARRRATAELARVGLEGRAASRVTVLSGGEQQRVALARALVPRPALLLADEPTGNLDVPTAARMHGLLLDAAREAGAAVVLVTHNPDLAALADRVLTLHGGLLCAADQIGTGA